MAASVPPEARVAYQRALSRLREDAPAMKPAVARGVLETTVAQPCAMDLPDRRRRQRPPIKLGVGRLRRAALGIHRQPPPTGKAPCVTGAGAHPAGRRQPPKRPSHRPGTRCASTPRVSLMRKPRERAKRCCWPSRRLGWRDAHVSATDRVGRHTREPACRPAPTVGPDRSSRCGNLTAVPQAVRRRRSQRRSGAAQAARRDQVDLDGAL